MTSSEAIEHIKKGHKVRYRTWFDGKYVRLDKKHVVGESGQDYGEISAKTNIMHQADDGWELCDGIMVPPVPPSAHFNGA